LNGFEDFWAAVFEAVAGSKKGVERNESKSIGKKDL
jgi:hypothetical protein